MGNRQTLNWSMPTYLSTPNSHISSTLPSNILTSTSPLGRFLVLCPYTKKPASFLPAQNSKDFASSNGRTVFFLENDLELGRLRDMRSCMTPFTTCPVWVPLTKIATLGSSSSLGSLASNARFDRAFFGFLGSIKSFGCMCCKNSRLALFVAYFGKKQAHVGSNLTCALAPHPDLERIYNTLSSQIQIAHEKQSHSIMSKTLLSQYDYNAA